MPTFRATHQDTMEVVEYDAPMPQAEHLLEPWNLEELIIGISGPLDPEAPVDTRRYGGRRRLSKLEFVELFTDTEYATLLSAAKTSIQLEGWIKKLDLATPDANGDSVDMDSQNIQIGVNGQEMMGLIGEGRAEEILNA